MQHGYCSDVRVLTIVAWQRESGNAWSHNQANLISDF